MFRLTALSLLLLLGTLEAFPKEPDHLLYRSFKIQTAGLDSLLNVLPRLDSSEARVQYKALEEWAAVKGDLRFSYRIRLQMLRWLNSRQVRGVEEELAELLRLVEKAKLDSVRVEVLFYTADFYWGRNQFSKALEHYMLAYAKSAGYDAVKFPLRGEIIYTLGGRFYHFRDFQAAKKNFLEYWRTMPAAAITGSVSKLNTLALTFANLQEHDSAMYYFNVAEREATRTNDSFWIGLINGNKAYNYFMMGKYDEAIPLFEKEISHNPGTAEVANSLMNLGAIYLAKGNKEKALAMQKEGYAILLKANYLKNYSVMRTAYESLANTYAAYRDYQKAFLFMDSARMAQDSVNVQRNQRYITGAQHKLEVENHLRDLSEKEQELSQQTQMRNWSLVGIAIMGLFMLVFFRQNRRISKEKKRSDDLLLNILPFETAEELKQTGAAKAKNYEMVTVLFTDFQDFTEASENMTAEELVGEINYCYSEFDKILSRYGVEKIKTIGDSYMCAGGLPRESRTHAIDVVAVALEIAAFIEKEGEKRKALGKSYFSMRLGIHTGPVVAGIVGIKKFAYDIWGDTVNIASRMESSGEPGRINISETTYQLVKHRYPCSYRGEISAKNKGKLRMYFVDLPSEQATSPKPAVSYDLA